ncbi:NADH-quinone oxidoreductase subunit NuoF [Thermovenabulum sp.]|uniref:NADH-quinone oxidoreductase subunit NuoF n=1 Tax=Thermovenabulum sp. TaxID=3100335 RepID=UPI003C7A03B2
MEFYRKHVLVCGGGGCISSGCIKVKDRLLNKIEEMNLSSEIKVIITGCMGPCHLGPMVVIYPDGVLYTKVTPEGAEKIIEKHLFLGEIVEELLIKDSNGTPIICKDENPFFAKQVKIALRNVGLIDPMNIEEYIAADGYRALAKVLFTMKPEDVIEEIKKSGLRGRGGAGFLTGLKWSFTAKAKGSPKYVLCNADEGDPGAFMDRSILEGDPHSVIEAMAIAGYAVGSNQGYVYVRAEYPLAVERLKHAIEQARERGLLGKDILNSGFDFDIDIKVGAGAFVCGEETALIASAEGKRGEPRPKPPFPANEGFLGKPTLINNVETYANICPIILRGADWFSGYGTENSKGTKVFALAGKIKNTGLVEVPMGTALGEIIYDIGGGIPGGKKFKAAQTGGPSGGCIPKKYLNTPVDYESLKELGTIMGSGGLIVVDEDTCMVDFAKYFLQFVQDESCGKCAPCRLGTKRMLEIMERITRGEGKEGDIERLIELGEIIKETALCGLGQTAPNPVLSTIRYFRDEYEAHIKYKKCPASVCASLFNSPCQNACPAGVEVPLYISAIRMKDYEKAVSIIRENNPFPAVCGRVCNHPCESKCRRAQIDEPLAIRALKRFVADYDMKNPHLPVVKKAKGKKIAVIGSGPAGLTAAYYLALEGYSVTVFEALPIAGGMLAIGIPEYRLPKDVLKSEIEHIKSAGVEIHLNMALGKDFTIEDLKYQGYDAIFIAIGAQKDIRLDIPGQELYGVYSALEFLKKANLNEYIDIGKKVAVIGGGNAAVDAARVALRKGAKEVNVFYRRGPDEMPALPEEVKDAIEEGVKFHFYTAPIRIIGEGGKVIGIEIIRMKPADFDENGRRKTVPIDGSSFSIKVDNVICALGQQVDLGAIKVPKGMSITIDKETMETSIPGVFAGGDCVTGPSTVIEAIASGRKVALSIDKYLGGNMYEKKNYCSRTADYEIYEEHRNRCTTVKLKAQERIDSFKEVELTLEESAAYEEACRCLRCDVKQNEEDEVEYAKSYN